MRKSKIPSSDVDVSFNESEQTSFHFEFISPIFGGGVSLPEETTKADLEQTKYPIRTATIRGHLRFWWRALVSVADHSVQDIVQLKKKEGDIWGLASSPGKIATILKSNFVATGSRFNESYVCFPLQGVSTDPDKIVRDIKKDGELILAFNDVSVEDRVFVEDAVKAWMMFGGYGARTRRGMGSVKAVDSNKKTLPVSKADIENFVQKYGAENGIQGVPHLTTHFELVSTGSDPQTALERGISRLKSFRQAPNIGRNPGQAHNRPGRSRWPEPDEIRRLAKQHANKHVPEHPVRKFPRAAFGMPILFQLRGHGEPDTHTLQPRGLERMASPLIIKPIATGHNHYSSLAILIKEDKNKSFGVELKAGRQVHQVSHQISPSEASQIRPIHEKGNSNQNPLLAFLHYFKS